MTEVKDRRRRVYLVLLAALWITLLILAVKVWAGWATRSLSLLAESLHTLVDGFSALLSLLAASSPYTKSGREIWGYGKRIVATTLALAAFLGFSGLCLLLEAMRQLGAAQQSLAGPFEAQINGSLIQLIGMIVAVSICLALVERHQAKALNSHALRLTGNHGLRDAWLSLMLIIGMLGIWRGYVWLDPLMAIALVGMVIRSFWRVLNWQLPLLVRQTAIAPEILAQLAHQVEGVTHCSRIRSYGVVGRHVLIEMELTLHPEFIGAARIISERIEGLIRERYGPVYAHIHMNREEPIIHQSLPPIHRSNPQM